MKNFLRFLVLTIKFLIFRQPASPTRNKPYKFPTTDTPSLEELAKALEVKIVPQLFNSSIKLYQNENDNCGPRWFANEIGTGSNLSQTNS